MNANTSALRHAISGPLLGTGRRTPSRGLSRAAWMSEDLRVDVGGLGEGEHHTARHGDVLGLAWGHARAGCGRSGLCNVDERRHWKQRRSGLTSPQCWSETPSWTPYRPPCFSLVIKRFQKTSSSLSPTPRPRVSHCPSLTPVATTNRHRGYLLTGVAKTELSRVEIDIGRHLVGAGRGCGTRRRSRPPGADLGDL